MVFMDEEQQNRAEKMAPFRIDPHYDPRVWGWMDLRPWFDRVAEGDPIGEVWLTGDMCLIATGPHTGKRLDALFAEMHEALLGPALLPSAVAAADQGAVCASRS